MSLRSSSQQPLLYTSNAISSSVQLSPSLRVCNLHAVPPGHVSDVFNPVSFINYGFMVVCYLFEKDTYAYLGVLSCVLEVDKLKHESCGSM